MCAEGVSSPRCHSKHVIFKHGFPLLNLQKGKNLFLLLWSRRPSWEWVEICISFVYIEIFKDRIGLGKQYANGFTSRECLLGTSDASQC